MLGAVLAEDRQVQHFDANYDSDKWIMKRNVIWCAGERMEIVLRMFLTLSYFAYLHIWFCQFIESDRSKMKINRKKTSQLLLNAINEWRALTISLLRRKVTTHNYVLIGLHAIVCKISQNGKQRSTSSDQIITAETAATKITLSASLCNQNDNKWKKK